MQHFLFQPDEAAIQAIPLPANQARALIAAHRSALRETARIELDPTFPARFIQAFADSPNLTAPDETLPELIALFDAIRARTPESIPDETILQSMRNAFDTRCQGSVELLADCLIEGLE